MSNSQQESEMIKEAYLESLTERNSKKGVFVFLVLHNGIDAPCQQVVNKNNEYNSPIKGKLYQEQ